ncbi:PKD domain-containing protein [Micropruina sp.]|uniref:PKD domain-containing protein n=1 Tax=Micropruina sp. TaxID=2737536 RepID=UPI0039E3EED4
MALAMGTTLIALGAPRASAEEPAAGTADAPWVDPSLYTGLTSDTAAASCWEIKQLHPDAPTGAYWLLTPSMAAPQQFWCDQDTDGGGWVKVGQGRQNWEYETKGRGTASDLLQALPAADSGTTQLPTQLIDQVLNKQPITSLADGIRVRRALNVGGTDWQEVRLKPTKSVGWFWSFGAIWPLSSWTVGTASGTSGNTSSFGSGSGQLAVNTLDAQNQNYTWGFSYGSGVTGSPAAGSYLWSATAGVGGARPYSFVYVRPTLMSADMSYTRVPNSGTSKVEQEIVPDANAMTNPWGVTGLAVPRQREGDVEVQDMVAIGNTMYVGGQFRYVQRDEAGTGRVEQPFLAAFNATTGEYIPSFKPVLNQAVLAVAPAGNGRLAVGGKFSTVGGQPAPGFALIDATTGALSGPQPTLTDASSPGTVRVEVIKAAAGDLYIGGSFTHTAGPTGATRYTRNVSRINATTAMPVVGWQPEFNGTVNDLAVEDDGAKVFFAGFFTQVGTATTNRAAALPTSGSPVPYSWSPVWSSTNDYQRTIETKGNRVYVGGSEHSMFSFDTTSFARISTHVTNPKGDFQTLQVAGDFLIGGSHSNWFIYQGGTNWPNVGSAWDRADAVSWINAWRLDGNKTRSVESFSPAITSRTGEAGWATAVAPDGTIWAGGDFTRARVQSGGGAWTGAFVRFGYTDGAAPNIPTNFRSTATTSTTATLAWSAPSGGVGNGGSYQVLRDNKVIASTTSTSITVPLGGERRYFVRAADRAGNISASTAVVTVPGGNPAPVANIQHTVSGLNVAFDANGSTDNGSIASYHWSFGDGETSTDPVVTHHYAHGGTYDVRLTVVDNDGAWTTATYSLELAQPAPADIYGATVFGDQPWAYWRLDELSGDSATDVATGLHNASYQQGVTRGVTGIVTENAAARFDGADDVVVSTDRVAGPTTYSTEAWFRTTTNRGGKIIGFGGSPSGLSSSYDRHVYMQNDGRLVFGVYVGGEYKITTNNALNDGSWHHVVATQSSDGMRLYVDGVLAGTNPQNSAEGTTGYWRVGGDNTWGSTSPYFQGDIDEPAIYTVALTPQQVAAHYAEGTAAPNQLPTASFTATVDQLKVDVNGSASSDPDGTIASYKWEFGDGSDPVTGSSPTADHTYATAGDFTIKLTVTDNRGGTATKTEQVTTGTQASGQVIAESANWRYYYDASAPAAAWKTSTFDDSGWSTGAAPIGYGSALVATNLNPTSVTSDRPRAVYFRTDFTVVDPSRVSQLKLTGVADDGVVIYVNGTEVKRENMPSGSVSHATYATAPPPRTTAANANPVEVEVPTSLLVAGRNVVSAETHVNYRGTPDVSFKLKADITISSTPINRNPVASLTTSVSGLKVDVDGTGSSDPDGTVSTFAWDFGDGASGTGSTATHTYTAQGTYTVKLKVTDNQGATDVATKQVTVAPAGPETQELVASSASWKYYYDLTAPAAAWKSPSFDDSGWSAGVGPIGYGSSSVETALSPAANTSDRPRAVYFRNSFNITNKSQFASLEITSVADDGVVIYVNGTEVKRENMPSGTISHTTFANEPPPRTTAANANPVVVQVPMDLLVNGVNVITAETHVNYRGTPDLSFKLKAVATLGGN